MYNPELLDKNRVLAITKTDLLDSELIDAIRPTLPEDLPAVFISSIANTGITTLKDLLWRAINS
jgi:GTP-binding protein